MYMHAYQLLTQNAIYTVPCVHIIIYKARTCTEAGKSPGQCAFEFTSCYVPGDNCYCDAACTLLSRNDCCKDVAIEVGTFAIQ